MTALSTASALTRLHLHSGNPDWPDGVHPGVIQIVVRGSEKTVNEAFVELFQENYANIPEEARTAATWDQEVVIACVGGMDAINARAGKKPFSAKIPLDLAARFPNLRRLYLWNVSDLEHLDSLPEGLDTLDVRECAALRSVGKFPAGLETLILENCVALTLDARLAAGLNRLAELSVKGSPGVSGDWLRTVLRQCGQSLRTLDASDGVSLTLLETNDLPETLEDLRLNGWKDLQRVDSWPPALRRLELRGAERLPAVPDFPETIDFVDLGGMKALTSLPVQRRKPRTLRIYRSGLDLPAELHGTGPDANAAAQVDAHLSELDRAGGAIDNEVKLLLLGNGRCGKTSLARRLLRQGRFNRREDSTHGIRLWTGAMPFPGGKARVNVWDFGGQDLYHNTHRLFLESRAVFLVCRTAHADGADDATDAEARKQGNPDKPRPIEYWLEQVDSLENAPGRETGAPRLRLWTKADRGEDGKLDGELAVSARKGTGFEELRRRLPELLGDALGSPGRRTWPRSVIQVKEALRRMKQAGGGKKHRYLTMEEFTAVVCRYARGGAYEMHPELLLEIFHRSGFLYYQPVMGDRIILDQRWALDGIYAVFDRRQGSSLEKLGLKGGEFTSADLGRWVWNGLRYTERDQSLFIDFMQSCRICFELLPRWETPDGKAVYVAVSSLPEENELSERATQAREGLAVGEPQVAHVTSEGMARLLAEIGKRWRRSALLWRWGGQIQSFSTEGQPGKTLVHFNWKAFGPESMKGELTVRGSGADFAFVQAVLQFFRSEDAGKLDLHAPDPKQATEVRVGISYAGDGAYLKDWRQLQSGSKERWPRALAQSLTESGVKVEDYRLEQGRWRTEQTHDRRAYIEHVASRDFLVIFVTQKYLQSEWCLYEAMRMWERIKLAGGTFDPTRVWVAVFPEAKVSEDDPKEWRRRREEFLGHWKKRAKDATDDDLTCRDWYRFAREEKDLKSLWIGLMRDWEPKRLPTDAPDDLRVSEWTTEIRRLVDDPKARLQMAREVWKGNEKKRAANLLKESCQMSDPTGWRERLRQPFGDDVLDEVAVFALGLLQRDEASPP